MAAVELWMIFSVVSVALIGALLFKWWKDGQFTRRKAAVFLVAAPVVFVLSGLFLSNTLVNPAGSLQFQLGRALCIAASPVLLLSGIFMYVASPHEEKKKPAKAKLRPGEKPATPLPEWEQTMRKVYGLAALLLIGLLVLSWSPLMLLGLAVMIPYIALFAYMLAGRRGLVASVFFLVLWYAWFSVVFPMPIVHFSQIFTEVMRNQPYFGPLGYNVWFIFYSVVMFSGAVVLLLSSLSGVKQIAEAMSKIFNAKTFAAIAIVPVALMFVLPPGLVTNPNVHRPSMVAAQATDIGINEALTERHFDAAAGEWVYSVAVRYNGRLVLENVSIGGTVVSAPFDNRTVVVIEDNADTAPNFPNSGTVVIRDKAFVEWVSLVSRNGLGEAIYGVGWF
ncbi:MAG: hypothetical protein NT016_03790 [Candidatus Aenigmarchaeota archaeon]|nr:hypothetical protein [Candidatus Aenigmarchaeota archaeon]